MRGGLAAYVAVTAAYWAFMLTDGALRMLVLLHFHTLGFSPVQLAYLFLLYELAGIVTNLSAGWIAARFGLASTLYAGLSIQIIALLALSRLDPGWAVTVSVVYVMAMQGASGVAKDLAKMSAKSAVKVLAPETQGSLFRWVAVLTGSKNAVKGVGFLLGAGLLAVIGFVPAVLAMAAALTVILFAVATMPEGLPAGRKGERFAEVFSNNPNINWLSAARVFLFGARDVWFVVGVPIYFYAVLSDGSEEGNRTAFFAVGCFMAVWTILYGAVQARAPAVARSHPPRDGDRPRGAPLGRDALHPGAAGGARLAGGYRAVALGHAGHGTVGLRRGIRGELLAPLLPGAGLLPGRAGHDGRRLLLHGERRRPTAGHAAFRADVPDGWPVALPRHRGGDGRAEPARAGRLRAYGKEPVTA